jgi:hypothetical protein
LHDFMQDLFRRINPVKCRTPGVGEQATSGEEAQISYFH